VLIRPLRWTGLRVGEALALTAEDVDLERRVVRVLGVVLLTWIDGLRARDDWRPDMPLLATRGGTPWKEQFAWRIVKRVARRAEVRVTGSGPHSTHR